MNDSLNVMDKLKFRFTEPFCAINCYKFYGINLIVYIHMYMIIKL